MRSGRRSRGRRTPSPCGLAPVPHSASWLVGVLPLLHEGVLSHTFAAYARVTLPRAKYLSALFLQPRHPNPPEFQISFEEFPLPRGPLRVRPRLGLGGDPRLVLHSVENVLQLVVIPYLAVMIFVLVGVSILRRDKRSLYAAPFVQVKDFSVPAFPRKRRVGGARVLRFAQPLPLGPKRASVPRTSGGTLASPSPRCSPRMPAGPV